MTQVTRLRAIDSHTGGEPTRVIIDGFPDLGAGSMAERLEVFRRDHDDLRSAVVCEPRGHSAIVGALLCEPIDPTAACGVIFFNNVGYLGMCGHVVEFAGAIAGEDKVDLTIPPVMGAEDFSFMLNERPGAFIFIGNGDSAGLHHPAYNFNDDVIPYGTSYWVKLVETAQPA